MWVRNTIMAVVSWGVVGCAATTQQDSPACRELPPPPGRAARELRPADSLDQTAARHHLAGLVFHVRSGAHAEPNQPLRSASVAVYQVARDSLTPAQQPIVGGFTDSSGYFAADSLPAGRVAIRIRGLGYIGQQFHVDLRSGYMDTLDVALAPTRLCLAH